MLFLADAYLHTLDPFAVRFPASWPVAGIRWYGLAYAAGFLIGWMMIRWMARTGRTIVRLHTVGDLMFYIILGVLLGGRLGYALFYEQKLFIGFDNTFPFWHLLQINKGGMASHGGMIGVILACWLFARKHSVPVGHIFDLAALGCPAGLFLGRIANFINAELWGKALPAAMQSNPPWSVKYPGEILGWDSAHLKQIASLESIVGVSGPGFTEAVVQKAYQHDTIVMQTIKPLLTAYYPSQIFQAITDGPILFSMLALIWLKPRKPGVVASWFLIVYGGLRIVTEIFRQPDAGVPVTLGLQRGQWLSVLMMAAGVVGLWLSLGSKVPPLGGLKRSSRDAGLGA